MAATPADTEREIGRLRGDMTDALAELQRRLKGGVRGIAGAEARISTVRTQRQLTEQARDNPTLLGVAGVVVVGAIGYGIYAAVKRSRAHSKPQNRLKRGVAELTERVEGGVELSRRQLERQIERAKPRGLLLKVEPEDGGYMRVTDARLDVPAVKNKGRHDVIKKLLWAGFLSVFMAVGSVLARRVAGTVWKVTVREDPPTEKPKAD
ncbi:MAG TPA: hypothetical protein VGL99_04620 [Chloroflexota bacterium]|jgi:hypothetical protein